MSRWAAWGARKGMSWMHAHMCTPACGVGCPKCAGATYKELMDYLGRDKQADVPDACTLAHACLRCAQLCRCHIQGADGLLGARQADVPDAAAAAERGPLEAEAGAGRGAQAGAWASLCCGVAACNGLQHAMGYGLRHAMGCSLQGNISLTEAACKGTYPSQRQHARENIYLTEAGSILSQRQRASCHRDKEHPVTCHR